MIAFLKKFINSTIGTSGMIPLDELIKKMAGDNKSLLNAINSIVSNIKTTVNSISNQVSYIYNRFLQIPTSERIRWYSIEKSISSGSGLQFIGTKSGSGNVIFVNATLGYSSRNGGVKQIPITVSIEGDTFYAKFPKSLDDYDSVSNGVVALSYATKE